MLQRSVVRLAVLLPAFVMALALWSFAAADAEPSAYRLGPGDQVIITVFGEEDLSMNFRLNDTGKLNYPFLGELNVEGLSVAELEQLITSGLKGSYLVDPNVTVSIGEYRPFFVHGEVKKPGSYTFQPGLTLEQAIAMAGGFTDRANRKRIERIRGDVRGAKPERITLPTPVMPGDVITVSQSFF